jgi:hypothetical protein
MKFRSLAVVLFCLLVSVHGQQSDDLPVPASFRLEGVPRIKNQDVKHLFFEPSAIKSNLIWDVDRTARKLLFVTDEKNAIYSVDSPIGHAKVGAGRKGAKHSPGESDFVGRCLQQRQGGSRQLRPFPLGRKIGGSKANAF